MNEQNDTPVAITNVKFIAKTDKAILVREDGVTEDDAQTGTNQWWIPKSVIEWTDLEVKGDTGSVEVQAWFAEKEEIGSE